MARPFELTVDNERLLRVLKQMEKVPSNLDALTGFNLFEVEIEGAGDDGDIATVFGALGGNRESRAPSMIPLARDEEIAPVISGDDRLHYADIALHPERQTPMYVKPPANKDAALRIITTGLLGSKRGNTLRDRQAVRQEGKKLRYHGVFPLTADAADVVGEGIDLNISNESEVIVDERFGRIKGVAGVPQSREALVRAVIGGPLLVGQVNGDLKILELQPDGTWKTYDVTAVASYQQKFMDLAEKDMVYLAEREKDEKSKQRKRLAKYLVRKAPTAEYEKLVD